MKIVYSNHVIQDGDFAPHSIFLAGPTPRKSEVTSWRPEALEILRLLKYRGTVFVPEWDSFSARIDYLTQVDWERKGLLGCSKIVIWVPRQMKDMPALTTNVEFGYFLAKRPNDVYYGRPFWAEHCRYLDWLYTTDTQRKPFDDLRLLLEQAILE